MKLMMVSVDHTSAELELRECFSFTESGVRKAVKKVRESYPVEGAVLLSTCNRTELYLSGNEVELLPPVEILREISSVRRELPQDAFRVLTGEAAALHLMEVACGLRSRILCEDQIIAQVKRAALLAREERVSDPVLETLFRLAATAAKKAKTTVRVKAVPASAADSAVRLLLKRFRTLSNKRALVIGNGEMGRLCASRLAELGCHTTVTLRTYRHGETVVPRGCLTIPYEEREQLLSHVDFVISATASPHFTLTRDMLSPVQRPPVLLIDLAVPRDIDPEIEKLAGIECKNIDQLDSGPVSAFSPELSAIQEIIKNSLSEFLEWLRIHECRDNIKNIKRIVFEKVGGGLLPDGSSEEERERIELTVHQTVDLLMYSIKGELSPELTGRIERHLKKNKSGGKPVE